MNNINLSEEAQADLAEIKEYISEKSGNTTVALSIVSKITKAIRILQNHALAGPALSSVADIESDYRFLIRENYLIFYRVQGREVFVDRVLYGRRNYLRILFSDILEDE